MGDVVTTEKPSGSASRTGGFFMYPGGMASDSLSAYGHIKRAELIHALPPEEQEELESLEANWCGTEAAQARLDELWAKAVRDHVAPQLDPLFEAARQVGIQMRSHE